jgi:DNA mismatch endonuclease, patch repair protein
MRSNRRAETEPEIALRSALHSLGLRFRKDFPLRIGGQVLRPDVVFTRARVAIYVDGCFWHRCPQHGTMPRANARYWREKLNRNVQRDREKDRLLTKAGWAVVHIWEHEDPTEAAEGIRASLRQPRTRGVPVKESHFEISGRVDSGGVA